MVTLDVRRTLRTTVALGASGIGSTVINLVRTKVAAIILGPEGIGLIGLLQGVMTIAGQLGAMGISVAGIRQVAAASSESSSNRLALVRQAMIATQLFFGVGSALVLWLFRESIAIRVLGDEGRAGAVGWLAVGVCLNVIGSGQLALLNGMSRPRLIAIGQTASALLSCVAGTLILITLGDAGIVFFVLSSAVATVLVHALLILRLPKPQKVKAQWLEVALQARTLLWSGVPILVASLVASGGLLLVRAIVARETGIDALGQVQAGWTISQISVAFILNAMYASFMPRLSGLTGSPLHAGQLICQQQQLNMLVAAPILLGLAALAPNVLAVLFSPDFRPAAEVLRWQLAGEAARVLAWVPTQALVASKRTGLFLGSEAAQMGAYVLFVLMLLPHMGTAGVGLAYFCASAGHLLLMQLLAWRLFSAKLPALPTVVAAIVVTGCALTALVSRHSQVLAFLLGLALTVLLVVAMLWHVACMSGTGTWAVLLRRFRLRSYRPEPDSKAETE